jgi:hypothetical protein
VPVVQARDNVLILRDLSVAAAVGVGSVDDALLSEHEIRAKLDAYREDLLKQVRFEFQIVIGTRPQNLDAYYDKLLARVEHLQSIERLLYALEDGLQAYCQRGQASLDAFGFHPDDLRGTPGAAHALAWLLASGAAGELKLIEARGPTLAAEAAQRIVHWQDLLARRAPVRTVYFATSYHVRLASKATARLKGPLSESEIAKAIRELDSRCSKIARIIERMQLKAWRATHDELVREIQRFYHPSQADLARREMRAERSVAMGFARASL